MPQVYFFLRIQTVFMMYFPKYVNNSNLKYKKTNKMQSGIFGGQIGMLYLKLLWKCNIIKKSIIFRECMYFRVKISWQKTSWRWEKKVHKNIIIFLLLGTYLWILMNLKHIMTLSQKEKHEPILLNLNQCLKERGFF